MEEQQQGDLEQLLTLKTVFTQNCILQLMSRQSRPGIQDDLCDTRQKLKALSSDKSLV